MSDDATLLELSSPPAALHASMGAGVGQPQSSHGAAAPTADAIVGAWREIALALEPIIGRGGVAALYRRSLHLQQEGARAAAAGGTILQTFHHLLFSLLGESLAERLLGGVRPADARTARLVEANEQLVIAALRAQAVAEAAGLALEEASWRAGHDALTALPNRLLLLDRLASAAAHSRRYGVGFALLYLDIDKFKDVNDTLGHSAGDQVLQHAAHCLVASIREADTVSRQGGDEFVLLLAKMPSASDVVLVVQKLVAALGTPTTVGDQILRLTASIGISLYPEDGEDAKTLIDRADAAMYQAKKRGGGQFVFHHDEPLE